jgi:hypothetical protein
VRVTANLMRVNDAAAHSPTALRDNPATVDRQHDAGIGLVHLLAPNLLREEGTMSWLVRSFNANADPECCASSRCCLRVGSASVISFRPEVNDQLPT